MSLTTLFLLQSSDAGRRIVARSMPEEELATLPTVLAIEGRDPAEAEKATRRTLARKRDASGFEDGEPQPSRRATRR